MASNKKAQQSLIQASDIIPNEKSLDHKVIYSNTNRFSISPWDVRVVFGQMLEREHDQARNTLSLVNEDAVTIVMSPQLAKATMKSMIETLEKYEGMFGPIPDVSTPVMVQARAIAVPRPKKT